MGDDEDFEEVQGGYGFNEERNVVDDESDQESMDEEEIDEDDEMMEQEILHSDEGYVVVKKEDRISSNIMTKFEFVNLVSTRVRQINEGEKIYTDGYTGKMDAVSIARYEIKHNMIPAIIRRIMPDRRIEIWNLDELVIDPKF